MNYVWDGNCLNFGEDLEPRLGEYVYSPDLSCKWHHIEGTYKYRLWAERSKSEIPKQFLVQLLLLGVPT